MSLERLIPFIVDHNALVIQGLVAAILLLTALMAIRAFVKGGTPEPVVSMGGAGVEQLEATIKKLLERAQTVSEAPPTADTAPLVAEIEELRKSVAEKQDQIEQMKLAPAAEVAAGAGGASGGGMSSDDKSALEAQLHELQAKLAEYEIISEDIADLSFYKEENAKLQKQLESMKSGAGAVAAGPASPVQSAPPAAAKPAPAPVTPAPASEAPVPTAVPAEAPRSAASSLADVSAADPTQAMVDQMIKDAERAGTEKSVAMDDEELLRELSDAVGAQGPVVSEAAPAVDESIADSLFDVDRMTKEASHLVEVADHVDPPSEDVMGAGLDVDKMSAEADDLEKIKPEDAKLMGDFEDYMKKEGE